MKKQNHEQRLRRSRLARHRWGKQCRRRKRLKLSPRLNPNIRSEVRIVAPEEFRFSSNYHSSVSCLRELKENVLKDVPGQLRPSVWIDLSKVQSISPSAILVLAAEMDRWCRLRRTKLHPRNVRDWKPAVRDLLSEVGFFRLLGVRAPRRSAEPKNSDMAILPVISSDLVEGPALEPILEFLRRVAQKLGQDPSIYPALTEAAYNATLHAYPDEEDFEFPILAKTWWATAFWSVEEGVVKFMVYDQGVGIPQTLPRSQHWEQIRGWLGALAQDSSRLIEAALEADRSSLEGGHGKGLKDVIAPIEHIPNSKVRILSGKGQVLYRNNETIERRDEQLHLGGTLIEWTIPVGSHLREVES